MRFGTRLVDSRAVTRRRRRRRRRSRRSGGIGGARGWYYGNRLWRLRGLLDLLVGGVGLRRGRRDPEQLRVGDALDFWRVEAYEPDRLLRLAAEMKLPGRAWLEFEVDAGTRTARSSGRRRSSIPPGSPASPTGTASTRSTRASSAGCCARSRRAALAWHDVGDVAVSQPGIPQLGTV